MPEGEERPDDRGTAGAPGPPPGAWDPDDWRAARERWRRRRMAEAGRGGRMGPPWAGRGGRIGPPWARRRGFGCAFAFLFILVVASLVATMSVVVAQLGVLPGLVVLVVVLALVVGMGRTLFRTARTLDELVEATRRVQAGDYTTRVGSRGRPNGGLRAVGQLTEGFDTMVTRLEADETQRRTLLADISHELRTPLTVVQGNLEAILDDVYPPDPAHLGLILDETRVLGRLIDDLRTLALSEAGTLALHPEPTDPDVLVGEVVRSFEPAATTAGVELSAEIAGDLPILEIDPVRIREVLANLVANALRHTPSGGRVTIAGGVQGRWVRLEVRDTGRGIDPALLPHVFDRFVKGDDSRGSGLGLAIARQLVVAHGGEITAASTPGQGTTIRFGLPLPGG